MRTLKELYVSFGDKDFLNNNSFELFLPGIEIKTLVKKISKTQKTLYYEIVVFNKTRHKMTSRLQEV